MSTLFSATTTTLVLTISLIASAPGSAVAQNPTGDSGAASTHALSVPGLTASDTVEVRLTDGSIFFGRLLEETATLVRLELLGGGVIELARDLIRDIGVLRGRLVDGEVWHDDPNATRLFFAPTGRALSASSGYFSVYELVVPFVAYGVTDRITLAAGTPLTFASGAQERLFWAAPKVQIVRREEFNASVGVLHFVTVGGREYEYESGSDHFGIGYAVATIGPPDRALTAGIGLTYAGGSTGENEVVLMLGAETRVSRSVKLVTENYFFPGEGFGFVAIGPRFFGDRLTADLGLAAPFGGNMSALFVFPLVSFVYNW